MAPLRLAHRGDWRAAPENTLGAFAAALAIPACDGLEFDVQLTADGTPVVIHDETLERIYGRHERVDATDDATLAALGIPTLVAVLAAAGGRPFLDVELKGVQGDAAVEIVAAARGTVRGADLDAAVVSSFSATTLERVGSLRPSRSRWLNADDLDAGTVALAVELRCVGVSVKWRAIDPRSIAMARIAGLDVAAWTVRRRATFDRLAALGVVAVCAEAAALDG